MATSIDLMYYRSPKCYNGKMEGPGGFYEVYGNLFAALNKEENTSAQA